MNAEEIKRRGQDLWGLRPPRERADLRVGREWRTVLAGELRVGDIWADKGVVVDTNAIWKSYMVRVIAGDPNPTTWWLPSKTEVLAFVAKE